MKHKTSPASLAQLLQPSLAFCFSLQPMTAYRQLHSCASLAGLVLCFIACFFTCDRSLSLTDMISAVADIQIITATTRIQRRWASPGRRGDERGVTYAQGPHVKSNIHRRRRTVESRRRCVRNSQLVGDSLDWTNLPTAIRVASWRRCERTHRQSWPSLQFLVLLLTSDIMKSLLKSSQVKIHVVKPLCSVFKLSTESVGSCRELVANSVHTADADATQLDIWVASASPVCTSGY